MELAKKIGHSNREYSLPFWTANKPSKTGQTVLSLPRIATESVSLCGQIKNWLRFWKSNQRFAERA
jgi:hypothetical protein